MSVENTRQHFLRALVRLQISTLHKMNSQPIVRINAGGTLFTCARSVLVEASEFFKTLLSQPDEMVVRDDTGAVYVDQDPDLFSQLIRAMRTLRAPTGYSVEQLCDLKNLCDFYMVSERVKSTVDSWIHHAMDSGGRFYSRFMSLYPERGSLIRCDGIYVGVHTGANYRNSCAAQKLYLVLMVDAKKQSAIFTTGETLEHALQSTGQKYEGNCISNVDGDGGNFSISAGGDMSAYYGLQCDCEFIQDGAAVRLTSYQFNSMLYFVPQTEYASLFQRQCSRRSCS